MKYLMKFDRDWSDEFQCRSYGIYNTKEGAEEEMNEAITNGHYFGTNEGWEEGQLSPADFKILEISEEEAEVITRLLGKFYGVGV